LVVAVVGLDIMQLPAMVAQQVSVLCYPPLAAMVLIETTATVGATAVLVQAGK
jgi:hypothetical protein